MKRVYRCGLSWLNVPCLSLLLISSANLEVKAEAKVINFNDNSIHLTSDISSNWAIAKRRGRLIAPTDTNQIQPTRPTVPTSVIDLLAQQNPITRVTGVKLKQTDSGLEVILITAIGNEKLVPLILPEGNKLAIDLLDATLALPTGNEFIQANPASGIKSVALTKIDDSSIRLTITGENKAPSAEVIPSQVNLIFSVTPEGSTAAQAPDEEIEVIATGEGEADDYYVPDANSATRTDTPN